jgi:hypothetical protein
MATRYWAGGNGTWDNSTTTNWSAAAPLTFTASCSGTVLTTTGSPALVAGMTVWSSTYVSLGTVVSGSVNTWVVSVGGTYASQTMQAATIGASAPTTADSAIFDSSSGTVTVTVTATATSLDTTAFGLTDFNFSLTGSPSLTVGGSFTFSDGTITLNNFTLSCSAFSSSTSNTRSIAFGTGNIALTSTTAGDGILGMQTATNFTYTGTGGFTRNQAATATVRFGDGGGATSSNTPNLTVNAGASALTITTGGYLKNVDFTGSTCTVTGTYNSYGNLTLATGGTYTALVPTFIGSATITSAGKTLGNTTINGSGITVTLADAFISSGVFTLTQGTIDVNSKTLTTNTFVSSNTNTRSIAFGTGSIPLSSTTAATTVLSMATATGFTWSGTGGFTRNQAATATLTFGSTAGGSTTNAPNVSVNAGASALTITAGSYFANLIFTGSTSTVTATYNACGNLTLATGGTYTAVLPTLLTSATITSTAKTLGATTINTSGTITCADALTLGAAQALTFTLGTLQLKASVTSTVGSFVTSGTTLKYLQSTTSGTRATLSDASGTNTATYLSIQDSAAAGAAIWDATSATNVNAGNNTSWNFGSVFPGNFFFMFN